MESEVRVRFAPSPTGHLHVGNARTAILNWIFARQNKGQFILRIEDTDVERSTEHSEQSIFEDLEWLGLNQDEGPKIGGAYGPYRQSERSVIYPEYLNILKNSGKAYPCFCTDEVLEEKRKTAMAQGETYRYDRRCLTLSENEKRDFEKAGRVPVWRFQVPGGQVNWLDLVKGELSFDAENFGDFVIVRSDGTPTYNFAAVVDDALMKITHVIRGDDHVSNTPKQILIYQALNFQLPRFGHIPMILGPDRTRLSKRHGATSINEFQAKGYLPEALINFLSLLSWSSESEEEILTIERLIREFDFERMSKSPAIFDTEKLNWMNGVYIRQLPIERLVGLAIPFLQGLDLNGKDKEKLGKALSIVQDAIEYLSQIPEMISPFYQDQIQPKDGQAIALYSKETSQKVYWAFLRNLKHYEHLQAETFRVIMKSVQKETGVMGKDLWMPIRVALTGKLHGPDLPNVAEILGKDKCEKFVRNLID